jgi:hypothetical protein
MWKMPLILHKLIQGGYNIFIARSGRTFQVSVGKSKSSVCNISYGVHQGAILSPTLYNLFFSDAPTADGCELVTFADDTAIFHMCVLLKTDEYLRWAPIAIQLIDGLLRTIDVKLDAGLQGDFLALALNGQEVPWSSEVKYLGVTLDKSLTFATHTAKLIEKAERAFRIL